MVPELDILYVAQCGMLKYWVHANTSH